LLDTYYEPGTAVGMWGALANQRGRVVEFMYLDSIGGNQYTEQIGKQYSILKSEEWEGGNFSWVRNSENL
jgi:hypothetical protein